MTCQELSKILAEHPPSALTAEARDHLASCPGCRGLAEMIDGIQRMPVPQSLFTPEDVAPVRPMPSGALFIPVAFAVPLVLAALAVWWKGASGWQALPADSAALLTALSVAGLGALALGFYRQFKPGARDTIDGRAAMVVLAVGFAAFVSVEFGWHPADREPELLGAWTCFRFGTMVAVGASLGLLAWARLGFAANPKSASFWTGTLASMAGLIALGAHCPNLELSHLLLGHGTVILAGTFLVAWMGRRFFGLR